MNRKARLKLKGRTITTINKRRYKQFEREVKLQVREANRRLNTLERQHATGTWASGKLKTRVGSNKVKGLMYKGKRIKLKPKMTKTDLTQIQKATKQFLTSKTSTKKGINEAKRETIKSLQDTLNLNRRKGKKISDKDAETMYNMLVDQDFSRFNTKRKGHEDEFIGASALWSEIDSAIDRYNKTGQSDPEAFIERLQMLRKQDFSVDDRLAAERIYQRYVL